MMKLLAAMVLVLAAFAYENQQQPVQASSSCAIENYYCVRWGDAEFIFMNETMCLDYLTYKYGCYNWVYNYNQIIWCNDGETCNTGCIPGQPCDA
jgi:hypothetical protein